MTNEELATLIQGGRSDLYIELWKQVWQFVKGMALRRLRHVKKPSDADVDDLLQAGYIAVTGAVEAYDPEKPYTFNTILGYHLQREFNIACGTRTERAAHDPIHNSLSLDVPLSDDDPEGERLFDRVPAPGDMAEDVTESVYIEQLRAAEERLLKRISAKGADLIRSTILEGESLSDCAKRYRTTETRIRGQRDSYMSSLRSVARCTPEGMSLRQFVDSNTDFYKQVGPGTFQRTHTSAPEMLTLRREALAQEYARLTHRRAKHNV